MFSFQEVQSHMSNYRVFFRIHWGFDYKMYFRNHKIQNKSMVVDRTEIGGSFGMKV